MRNLHDRGVRDALWRLTAAPRPAPPTDSAPLFMRAPAIIALWAAALLTAAALLALGRIQVPQVARGTVVAVPAERDSVTLLLLLSPGARSRVRVGQRVALDAGTDTLALDVVGVDSLLLDAAGARRRFADPASLVAHLDGPRLVARLSRCGSRGCLTPHAGGTYGATAAVGTRSLASYAMSGS